MASSDHRGRTVQLFSSWFCPYAQRAWIALEELGIPYSTVEVNPYQTGLSTKTPKPIAQKAADYPGFVEASPKGLVPALAIWEDGAVVHRVHDSLQCVSYMDFFASQQAAAVGGGRRLFTDRTDVREGMAVADELILPHFYRLLMASSPDVREAECTAIRRGLLAWAAARPSCSSNGSEAAGPYFLGKVFSAADVALAPWWPQRLDWIAGAYRQFSLPSEAEAPEFAPLYRFAEAVRERPSVVATLVDRERLVSNYSGYADGTATSHIAESLVRGPAAKL